jgi:2-aminophenol/2-amino-5-chlorophenol 1,6-dioxygenase beta subunit
MKLLHIVRTQRSSALKTAIPEHIAETEAETKGGSLTWMLAAMGWPDTTGDVLGYGSIIGTGNAVIEWRPDGRGARHG